MSRSVKKAAVFKDNDGPGKKKGLKRIANGKVRMYLSQNRHGCSELDVQGAGYKRISCSYEICDFKSYANGDYGDIPKYKWYMK